MSQLIYILLALALAIVLALNLARGTTRTSQEQTVNEVGTQLTGVATEVVEHVGRTHFDKHTFDFAAVKPRCGRVGEGQEATLLTAPGSYVQCATYADCPYMEGFNGLDTTFVRGDFEYTLDTLLVQYVDPADYGTVSTTPTFAKKVTVRIENPYLYVGDDASNTFSLTVERVFTYGCSTANSTIPNLVRPEDPACPSNPCAVRP